jgi:hypothetical protein
MNMEFAHCNEQWSLRGWHYYTVYIVQNRYIVSWRRIGAKKFIKPCFKKSPNPDLWVHKTLAQKHCRFLQTSLKRLALNKAVSFLRFFPHTLLKQQYLMPKQMPKQRYSTVCKWMFHLIVQMFISKYMLPIENMTWHPWELYYLDKRKNIICPWMRIRAQICCTVQVTVRPVPTSRTHRPGVTPGLPPNICTPSPTPLVRVW